MRDVVARRSCGERDINRCGSTPGEGFSPFELPMEDGMTPVHRPLLAITRGDPAGIGPEVVLKALLDPEVYKRARPLVIGDRQVLERAAPWAGATQLDYDVILRPGDGRHEPGVVTMLDLGLSAPDSYPIGQLTAEAGRAAVPAHPPLRGHDRLGARVPDVPERAGRDQLDRIRHGSPISRTSSSRRPSLTWPACSTRGRPGAGHG